MKTMFAVGFLITSCLSSGLLANEQAGFTCSRSFPGPKGYGYQIEVFEDSLEIKQRAKNAKFRPLTYEIIKNDSLTIPTTRPKFDCVFSQLEENNYVVRIQVFEKSLIILQSSRNGRYTPLVYEILK